VQGFKTATYSRYGDIQLVNHLTSVLRSEAPMSADSLTSERLEDVQQRWNRLLTGIADRQVDTRSGRNAALWRRNRRNG